MSESEWELCKLDNQHRVTVRRLWREELDLKKGSKILVKFKKLGSQ